MNSKAVYSRTLVSWRLAFNHAGLMLHFLTRALLLSLASAGLVFAYLCCWLDRMRSNSKATEWIISPKSAEPPEPELHRPSVTGERLQPVSLERNQPRTIDSLIRNKEVRV
jgi:hypothetical protein